MNNTKTTCPMCHGEGKVRKSDLDTREARHAELSRSLRWMWVIVSIVALNMLINLVKLFK